MTARTRKRLPSVFDVSLICDGPCDREILIHSIQAPTRSDAISQARGHVRLDDRWVAGAFPHDDTCPVCFSDMRSEVKS